MYKQAIVVRKDIELSKGKIATQVAHASVGAYKNSNNEIREEWNSSGSKKVVLKVENEEKILNVLEDAKRNGISTFLVKDAGKTEIPSGTITALGLGPDKENKIDKIVGNLSLV